MSDHEIKTDSEAKSKEAENSFLKDDWLIKPCEFYKAEYKDCTSLRGRFQQYYVTGEMLDCNHWQHDYNNCVKYTKKQDTEAMAKLIESENERRKERLAAARANNVWEYRTTPLKEWHEPTVTVKELKVDQAMEPISPFHNQETESKWDKMCVIS